MLPLYNIIHLMSMFFGFLINVNIVESMLSVIDNGNFNFKVLKK